VDEEVEAGRYTLRWDGRNSSGTQVADGVYNCRMDPGVFSTTGKMVLLR
jgi:flagellar hook assembly protein FlgD